MAVAARRGLLPEAVLDVLLAEDAGAQENPHHSANPSTPATPEELGWPPGFFEETYGSLRDEPLERLPQGEFDERDAIA